MRYSFVLLVLLFVIGSPSAAQDSNAQTESLDVHRFDQKVWKEVVGSTDYSEDRVQQKQTKPERSTDKAKSSDKRVKPRVEADAEDEDNASFNTFSFNLPFAEYIVYALVAGVIAYILFLVIRNVSFKTDRKIIANKPSLTGTASIENIQELETDRLLREAISAGNYRLAVRLCFLGMLKTLDEHEIIAWKKDKTNRDYLSELYAKQHHYDEIRRLTINYELVWYGEHDLTLNAYEDVIGAFRSMTDKLKSAKTA